MTNITLVLRLGGRTCPGRWRSPCPHVAERLVQGGAVATSCKREAQHSWAELSGALTVLGVNAGGGGGGERARDKWTPGETQLVCQGRASTKANVHCRVHTWHAQGMLGAPHGHARALRCSFAPLGGLTAGPWHPAQRRTAGPGPCCWRRWRSWGTRAHPCPCSTRRRHPPPGRRRRRRAAA